MKKYIVNLKRKNILELAVAIIICEMAGIIGSFFTVPAISTWYARLPKPALNPPSWVFGPVWTLLFLLMGISVFLVWSEYKKTSKKETKKEIRLSIGVFILQLELNILWSIIFFGMQDPKTAFVEIVLLWMAILATMIGFSKISKIAMWLLLPYVLWVSFAMYLNYSIWQLSGIEKVHFVQKPDPCTQQVRH